MAETWLDKCERFEKTILLGNKCDAKRLLKSYSRKQRYQCISYISDSTLISDGVMWDCIQSCIEGDFEC